MGEVSGGGPSPIATAHSKEPLSVSPLGRPSIRRLWPLGTGLKTPECGARGRPWPPGVGAGPGPG